MDSFIKLSSMLLYFLLLMPNQAWSREPSLDKTFQIKEGLKVRAYLQDGSKTLNLTFKPSQKQQRIPFGDDAVEGVLDLEISDLNKDGFQDLLLSFHLGGMGVNIPCKLYLYNPNISAYVPLRAGNDELYNVVVEPTTGLIQSSGRDGPAWWYASYQVVGGHLLRRSQTERNPCLDKTPTEAVLIERHYNDAGAVTGRKAVDADGKDIFLEVSKAKLFLYTAPTPQAKSKSYLVLGDRFQVLDNDNTCNWYKILYRKEGRPNLTRWIKINEN